MEKQKNTLSGFLVHTVITGIPIGIGLTTIISLGISYAINDGSYHPVSNDLINVCGSLLHAVLLQTAVSAVIGIAFVTANSIWAYEAWNLTQQTGIDFLVRFNTVVGGGWFCRWYPHTGKGIFSMTVCFSVIYLGIWITQWLIYRRRIEQINRYLK